MAQQTPFAQRIVSGGRELIGRAYSAQSQDFYRLLATVLFLVAIGLVMVLSASYVDALAAKTGSFNIFIRQAIVGILGLVLMTFASVFPMRFFFATARIFFFGSAALQVLTLAVGKEINGNRNWLPIIGDFAIQPSEFLKVGIILLLAYNISNSRDQLDDGKVWRQNVLFSLGGLGLVILGKDMGTGIIIFLVIFGVAILAGLPRPWVLGSAVLAGIGGLLLLSQSSSRWPRIMAWMNPDAPDPLNYNWQQDHGIWAIAAGGWTGVGLGNSKMKWSWIPEVENDFIFAIVGEELGLVGCFVVIALFVYLIHLLFRIAQKTQDLFGRLVVTGVGIWITSQAVINIAVVLDMLPVLGVPLPLISAGGSSLLALLGAVGLVLAVERDNHAGRAMGTMPKRFGGSKVSVRR